MKYKFHTIIGICCLILTLILICLGVSLQSDIYGIYALTCLTISLVFLIPIINNFFENYGSEDGGVE